MLKTLLLEQFENNDKFEIVVKGKRFFTVLNKEDGSSFNFEFDANGNIDDLY